MEWNLVPTGAPWQNGVAERMVGLIKRVLEDTLKDKVCSFNELNTILDEAALIVNSRPIGITICRRGDLEIGGPITPLHLMLGRSTVEVPEVCNTKANLLARLTFVQDVKQTFWTKWHHVVSQGLDRVYKWRREQRNLRPGDVVLMKNETAVSKMYRLARVYKVFPSESDSLVRKALIQYKNPGERKFRFSERPVQGLVLLMPIEEQKEWQVQWDHGQDEQEDAQGLQEESEDDDDDRRVHDSDSE